ncbi:MAG: TonB family protein [Bacteroidetes bacterium]|nr:MAG: TonB family protein [Bacteroidota bacterium]
MHPILLYLLKMMLCSGILFGYYRVALYNERFHQWNRFYLLGAMLLSIVVPLVEIPLVAAEQPQSLIYVIEILPATIVAKAGRIITTEQIIWAAAGLVSFALLVRLAWGLYLTIYKPYRNGEVSSREDIDVVITDAPSAPYSFFRLLFWRSNMDPDSPHGKRVLLHELTHIREKHSADKLFVELLLVLCWFNPFFWLIRKELYVIHEFLADRNAIEANNGTAFAEMILQTINAGHLSPLTNPFFSSHLKRRLKMITTSKKPQFSYLRRITALVAMAALSLVLMLTIEKGMAQKAPPPPPPPPPQKASLPDSIKSIRVNTVNGESIVTIELKNGKVRKMPVDGAIKSGYPVPPPPAPPTPPADRPNLLEKNTSSLTFEKGKEPLLVYAELVISSEQLDQINPNNIQSIEVLKGEKAIATYGEKGKNGVIKITPKAPLTNPPTIDSEALKEVVVTGYSNKPKAESTSPNVILGKASENQPLYVLNGKIITVKEASTIISSGVESINVLKNQSANDKYGDKGKNGAVEIFTKQDQLTTGSQQNSYDKVFTKMEQPPAYPGGNEAWTRYLLRNLMYPNEASALQIEGKVVLQFVVTTTGKLTDIKVVESPHISLSKEAMRLISAGGNWLPGKENNHLVNARITQTIVFQQEYREKKPEIVL